MNVIVRPVVPADRTQWEPLWQGYLTFYKATMPAAGTDLTWSRFFDAYEPMHALVADEGGKLIGVTHYIFHRNTRMAGPVCYLQDLFIAENARGKGVGRALIEAVYAAARQAGSTRVYWQTHETNATAMVLYDKLAEKSGFVVYRKDI